MSWWKDSYILYNPFIYTSIYHFDLLKPYSNYKSLYSSRDWIIILNKEAKVILFSSSGLLGTNNTGSGGGSYALCSLRNVHCACTAILYRWVGGWIEQANDGLLCIVLNLRKLVHMLIY